jgi:PleD family two-component response regulator
MTASRLPRHAPARGRDAAGGSAGRVGRPRQVPTLEGMRVAGGGDDPGMSAMLVRSLQREGYAVDAVDTGGDALWSVLGNGDEPVVLDAMISAPDGFEVCRRCGPRDGAHRFSS